MSDTKRYGKKYRVLTDAATHAWDLLSFWTSARDVEMDDGTTVQNKITDMETTINEDATVVDGLKFDVESAPVFSTSKIYSRGDIVNKDGYFYYCYKPINIPGPWSGEQNWNPITEALPFRFGIDSDGNYGYIKVGADSVTPFRSAAVYKILSNVTYGTFDLRDICNAAGINYSKLTNSNFVMQTVGNTNQLWNSVINGTSTATQPSDVEMEVSYSASTGVLTYNSGVFYRRIGNAFRDENSVNTHGILYAYKNGAEFRYEEEDRTFGSLSISAVCKITPKVDIYLIVAQGDIIDLTS